MESQMSVAAFALRSSSIQLRSLRFRLLIGSTATLYLLSGRVGRGFNSIHARDGVEDNVTFLGLAVSYKFIEEHITELNLTPGFRPAHGGIVSNVAIFCQLHHDAELDRSLSDAVADLVKKKIGTFSSGGCVIQVVVPELRQNSIAPEANGSIRGGEFEGTHGKERFTSEAAGNWLRSLYKLQRLWIRGQELLNRVGVRFGRITGRDRAKEFQEFLGSAGREAIDRVGDDIGMDMFAKIESYGATARAGDFGVVVRDLGDSRKVGEADVDWRLAFRVRSTRERSRICSGCEGAGKQYSFRVSRSEARMLTAVYVVESLQQFAAESQTFRVGRKRYKRTPFYIDAVDRIRAGIRAKINDS